MHELPSTGLWRHFLSLCQVPRPSKKEHQAVEFITAFAAGRHLACKHDSAGNVLIEKPASPGMEDRPGIILQAHLDMVPQKEASVTHDFERDPILPYVTTDGCWIKAQGTTLGADDGIGVAAAMEVLSDDTLVHGPISALFTVDEETGLTGAVALEPGWMKGSVLLNLDNEEEGEFCIGCAGGLDLTATFHIRREPMPQDMSVVDVELSGLKGGHSGTDINLGRGNALKLMNRFLWMATGALPVRLIAWHGGEVRNAIPRHTSARLAVPADCMEELQQMADLCNTLFSKELQVVEDGITLTVKPSSPAPSDLVWGSEAQHDILSALYALPNGVIRMSAEVPGLVETSVNWGIVETLDKYVRIQCLLRSSRESAKGDLANMMQAAVGLAGGRAEFSGGYPGWAPQPDTRAAKLCTAAYERLFGRRPVVKAIHAGLECGIIGGKYPGLEMVSFGPTIKHPHSPDEALHIASVEKFWQLLVEIIKG